MRQPMYIVQGTDGKWSPPITAAELHDYVRRGYIKPHTRICDEAATLDYSAAENPLLAALFRELGIQISPVPRQASSPPPVAAQPAITRGTEVPKSKASTLATLGFRLLLCGAVIAAYFLLFFDATAAANPALPQAIGADRANAAGLAQDRTLGTCFGFAFVIAGALLIGAGHFKGEAIDWRKIIFGIVATKAPRWSVWAVAVLAVASVAFVACLSVAPGGMNARKLIDAPGLIGSSASAMDSKLGVVGVPNGVNGRVYEVAGVGEITARFDTGVCNQLDIKLASPAQNVPEALAEAGLATPNSKPYSSFENGHSRHTWWQGTFNGIDYQRIGASGRGTGFDDVGLTVEPNNSGQSSGFGGANN